MKNLKHVKSPTLQLWLGKTLQISDYWLLNLPTLSAACAQIIYSLKADPTVDKRKIRKNKTRSFTDNVNCLQTAAKPFFSDVIHFRSINATVLKSIYPQPLTLQLNCTPSVIILYQDDDFGWMSKLFLCVVLITY